MEKIMKKKLTKFRSSAKLIAVALASVTASVLHASNTLVGGGATLPAIGYVGGFAATPTSPQVSGGSVDPDSLFGVYSSMSGNTVSYCLVGSGSGKDILAGIANNNVQDNCPTSASGTSTLYGFGAQAVGRTDLIQPNFVAADAPLSQSDYSNYKSVHTATNANPTEFPVMAGAIAITFNLTDSLNQQVTSSEVNFSDTQLCLIFSGQISNWSDSRLAGAFTLPAGHSVTSAPINVQYRSNGSGTTFALGNHLTAACNVTTNPLETSQYFFSATTAVTYLVQNFFGNNGILSPNLPDGDGVVTAKWTGFSSDSAMAYAVKNTANSIAYMAAANALSTTPNLQIADVNGASPIANFNEQLVVPALSIVTNNVISETNASNGRPQIQAIPNSSGACIKMVNPIRYALANNYVGSINPAGNYPIIAVSYLLGNAIGNGSDLANMQALLNTPYNAAIQSKVTTIGGATGLQFLNVSAAFSATAPGACLVN